MGRNTGGCVGVFPKQYSTIAGLQLKEGGWVGG